MLRLSLKAHTAETTLQGWICYHVSSQVWQFSENHNNIREWLKRVRAVNKLLTFLFDETARFNCYQGEQIKKQIKIANENIDYCEIVGFGLRFQRRRELALEDLDGIVALRTHKIVSPFMRSRLSCQCSCITLINRISTEVTWFLLCGCICVM